jgi:hypothetical protein
MLLVLTTVPVVGMLCTAFCTPSVVAIGEPSASTHHGAGGKCEAASAAPLRLKAPVAHDCNHQEGTSEPPAAVAGVRGLGPSVSLSAILPLHVTPGVFDTFAQPPAYSPPRDSTPSSGARRILRI